MKEQLTEEKYEAPALAALGSLQEMTEGQIFANGQDGQSFFGFPLGS
jgi:hypothetical protein